MSSNLFSGLDKLGLDDLSSNKIFEEDSQATDKKQEKKVEAKIEFDEVSVLFDKTYECPVCQRKITAKTPRIGKIKKLGSDTDMRPIYQNVDLLKYDCIVCKYCGYASLTRFFANLTSYQIKAIKENITPKFNGIQIPEKEYSYDDAILQHQLALANSIMRKAKSSERAYVCLKLAWLCRGKAEYLKSIGAVPVLYEQDLENEKEYLKQAYEGFKSAMGHEMFPICGMDEWQFIYLVAELARRNKDYQTSLKLISDIILARNADSKIKDRARDIKDIIKEEVKE